jgi:hypothetical protein
MMIPQYGEWAKIISYSLLVKQTLILERNVFHLRLFIGLAYGRFARRFPARVLYECFILPTVVENYKPTVLVSLFT